MVNLSGGAKERRKKSFKHHVSHQAPKNYYITTYQITIPDMFLLFLKWIYNVYCLDRNVRNTCTFKYLKSANMSLNKKMCALLVQ